MRGVAGLPVVADPVPSGGSCQRDGAVARQGWASPLAGGEFRAAVEGVTPERREAATRGGSFGSYGEVQCCWTLQALPHRKDQVSPVPPSRRSI